MQLVVATANLDQQWALTEAANCAIRVSAHVWRMGRVRRALYLWQESGGLLLAPVFRSSSKWSIASP